MPDATPSTQRIVKIKPIGIANIRCFDLFDSVIQLIIIVICFNKTIYKESLKYAYKGFAYALKLFSCASEAARTTFGIR